MLRTPYLLHRWTNIDLRPSKEQCPLIRCIFHSFDTGKCYETIPGGLKPQIYKQAVLSNVILTFQEEQIEKISVMSQVDRLPKSRVALGQTVIGSRQV